MFFRRIHCKSNSLHINLFIAFILRASISFIKECLFVHGLGLKGDVDISVDGAITFNDEGTVGIHKKLTVKEIPSSTHMLRILIGIVFYKFLAFLD